MLTAEQQLELIKEIHDHCYRNSSFSSVGIELAYVTQAVLSNMKCELNPLCELIRFLKQNFPENHAVWQHIYLEPTVICINCEAEVLWDHASFCPPLNGWLGHNCCVDGGAVDGYDEYEISLTQKG